MNAPLIVTHKEVLREELLRLAAAAGLEPEVSADPELALRRWSTAPLVLVGADLAEAVARLDPPPHPGVHLVDWGRIPDETFRAAVTLGVSNVAELPRSDAWLLELLGDAGEPQGRDALTVGVVGGSGGAGATTFACALAQVAGRHETACLIDTDPQGPGCDRVLGMEDLDGMRWDALGDTAGRLGSRAFREALPSRHGVGVLTWVPGPAGPLQPFAVREAVSAAMRGHDVVVLDLARTGGPLSEELMARCRHLVVVIRATVPGLASARRIVERAMAAGPVSLVLRGHGVDPESAARAVGAPVLWTMGDQRGLNEAVDLGCGPVRSRRGVLARAAVETLRQLREESALRAVA